VLYATTLTAALTVAVRVYGTTILDVIWLVVLAGVSRPVFSRVRARWRAQEIRHSALIAIFVLAWWDVLAMFFSDRRRAYARIDTIFGIARLEPPPTKVRWRETPEGEELIAAVHPGQGLTSASLASREWEGKLHDAAGPRCTGGVRIDNLDEGGMVRLTWIYRDPLAKMRLGKAPVVTAKKTSIRTACEIGSDARGNKIRVLLWKTNILLGGMLDQGKSNVLAILASHAALDPTCIADGVDLKGGVELAVWLGTFDQIATTPDDADALVRRYLALCHERTAALTTAGELQHIPTKADPARILFIDEFSRLATGTQALLFEVMQLGRACSVSVVAATPRPSANLMSTDTRSIFHTRIAMKCRDKTESNIILGAEMDALGFDASQLRRKGEFLIVSDESRPTRCLAYWLERDDRRDIAARTRRFDLSSEEGHLGPDEQDMDTGRAEPLSESKPAESGAETAPTEPPGLDRAPAQAKVWKVLAAHPDGITFGDLVAASGTSEFTVAQALKRWSGTWATNTHGKWYALTSTADVAS